MLDTLGKRLKCCRAATNTTAQEVVNHINETTTKESLSYASYTRWEADKVIPKRKNNLISYIADFLPIMAYMFLLSGFVMAKVSPSIYRIQKP